MCSLITHVHNRFNFKDNGQLTPNIYFLKNEKDNCQTIKSEVVIKRITLFLYHFI